MKTHTLIIFFLFLLYSNECFTQQKDTNYIFSSDEYSILICDSMNYKSVSEKCIVLFRDKSEESKITVPSPDNVKNLNLDTIIKEDSCLQVILSYGGGEILYETKFFFYVRKYHFVLY